MWEIPFPKYTVFPDTVVICLKETNNIKNSYEQHKALMSSKKKKSKYKLTILR